MKKISTVNRVLSNITLRYGGKSFDLMAQSIVDITESSATVTANVDVELDDFAVEKLRALVGKL